MDVGKYLQQKLSKATGKNAESWRDLQELYNQKHWHVLMQKVKELVVNQADFISRENIVEFREKFLSEFEHRTNPVTLVQVLLALAHKISEENDRVKFFESVKGTIKNDVEASTLFLIGTSELKMTIRDKQGRCPLITEVRTVLEEAEAKMKQIDGIVAHIHAPYYKTSSAYFREIGDYASFYREGLRYLGCIDFEKLSDEDKVFNAFCLGLAALLGDNIYNFGELLAHPILKSLKGTSSAYLVDLLYAFNSGDIKKFNDMKSVWQQQDDLKNRTLALERKIRLLALMELAFMKSVPNRKVTFAEVAKVADIDVNQVEFLIMKALANSLVRGRVDEVEKAFQVSWVQPRVLDRQQVALIAQQLRKWGDQVHSVSAVVKESAREILPQA